MGIIKSIIYFIIAGIFEIEVDILFGFGLEKVKHFGLQSWEGLF